MAFPALCDLKEVKLSSLKVGDLFRFLGSSTSLVVTGFRGDKFHGVRSKYLQYYDDRVRKLCYIEYFPNTIVFI